VNALHRRRHQQQASAKLTALNKCQAVAIANLAVLRMQQVLPVTTRATETAELPERIGARVILAWSPQHHDEQSGTYAGLFCATSSGLCARNQR
jgi:hypothetical protein